jgi:SAM-dependent methyltransferase
MIPPMPGPNEQQIAYWNDQAGAKWVELQPRIDTQIAPLGVAAMDRLAPAAGERILDVGCGCGSTTIALAERVGPHGRVIGMDVSAPMLARARERVREHGNDTIELVQGDAATHAFTPASVDAVFSRFGVMFFDDPTSAFANLRGVVAPRGRLAFVCWQSPAANEWVRVPMEAAARVVPLPPPPPPSAPGPFQLADRDRLHDLLERAGWRDVAIEPIETLMDIGGGASVDEAVSFLLRIGPLARALAELGERPDLRRALTDALATRLASFAGPRGVQLGGAAWIVTATAP